MTIRSDDLADIVKALNTQRRHCDHCWHIAEGPLLMQLKDGHVAQCCCKCQSVRQKHRAHLGEGN